MQKACGIRDGMLHVQHEGGDIDEGHLQRLDAMIEQLGQERQKYKMLLDVHMVGLILVKCFYMEFHSLCQPPYLPVLAYVSLPACLYVHLL
jgi:hypothetical protein